MPSSRPTTQASVTARLDAVRTPESRNQDTNALRAFTWLEHIHTSGEEWVNGLIHLFGSLLAVAGSVSLLRAAWTQQNWWYWGACLAYSLALVSVFVASTLSHLVRQRTWRKRFRAWDQGLVFILIVATFTPLAVAYLSPVWNLFAAVLWILAIAGFVSKVGYGHCVDQFAVWFYLMLGWLPVLAMPTIWLVAPRVVELVLVGGLIYTLGTILLMNDHRRKYLHAGWHLFVITASAFHFCAIYRFV